MRDRLFGLSTVASGLESARRNPYPTALVDAVATDHRECPWFLPASEFRESARSNRNDTDAPGNGFPVFCRRLALQNSLLSGRLATLMYGDCLSGASSYAEALCAWRSCIAFNLAFVASSDNLFPRESISQRRWQSLQMATSGAKSLPSNTSRP
jgi:hypothetical protein